MPEAAPRLSHVGLYVRDVPKMIDFYTKVLGFVVSDGAEDGRITFLSRNPSDHHQVVLVRGRTTDARNPDGAAGVVQRRDPAPTSRRRSARCAMPAARASARSATAMPGRSISRTPRATRSRCSATRPWYVPQPLRLQDRPRQAGGRALPRDRGRLPRREPGSSRSRNGAPRSARRSPRAARSAVTSGSIITALTEEIQQE